MITTFFNLYIDNSQFGYQKNPKKQLCWEVVIFFCHGKCSPFCKKYFQKRIFCLKFSVFWKRKNSLWMIPNLCNYIQKLKLLGGKEESAIR